MQSIRVHPARHGRPAEFHSATGAVVLVCVLAGTAFFFTRAHAIPYTRGTASPLATVSGPPPGALVDNTAFAAGLDSATATPLNVASNPVRTIVGTFERLAWDGPFGAQVPQGTRATFRHRLANTGNVSSEVRLDVANSFGDGFDLANFSLARDDDADGVPSPGDSSIALGDAILVPADAVVDLLVGFDVPAGTPAAVAAEFMLSATTLDQAVVAAVVDTVRTPAGPTLAFYRDGTYAATTQIAAGGANLFVEAGAVGCNLRPFAADTLAITLRSLRLGDLETFTAIETGPATGRFRIGPFVGTVLTPPGVTPYTLGVLETEANDELVASFVGCGAVLTEARLWIEPAGVAFDALSNFPVAGVQISLIDVTGQGNGGFAGGPARVFQSDGVTPAPDAVVTAFDGRYLFPYVLASTYQLNVTAPVDYAFPSQVAPSGLPVGHVIDAQGSYGAPFVIATDGPPIRHDVPLDPLGAAGLRVELTAARNTAEIGDAIDFTARVSNASGRPVGMTQLAIALPPGFAYLPGTTRRDTLSAPDPAGGAGPSLAFDAGALGIGGTATVRYRVRIGAGAEPGEALSRASATAINATSNVATASVLIVDGVFADEAGVLGTVFVDLNGDGRRSAGDPGLPGVRLVLDDGTFAVTDGAGQYSLYGLTPRTHGLRVDPSSLPDGAEMLALDHRDAGTPGLRFVDLQRGDFQRADFGVAPDSATRVAPEERRKVIAYSGGELAPTVRRPLPVQEFETTPGDPRARPTSGVLGESGPAPLEPPKRGESADPATPTISAHEGGTRGRLPQPEMPALLASNTSDLIDPADGLSGTQPFGFVGRRNGDTLSTDQITVRVAGRAAFALELRVNGDLVPLTRVGTRRIDADAGLQTWDYIGVRLHPGLNQLELTERATDGTAGAHATLALVAPDRLGTLEITAPERAPADGRRLAFVQVRAVDERGVPIAGRLAVTLVATFGEWQIDDADGFAPGVQTVIEGGVAEFGLRTPRDPCLATITVAASDRRAETQIEFVPDLRPLVAVGTAEWQVGWNHRLSGFATSYRARTGFEQAYSSMVTEGVDGRLSGGARASLFAKGRVGRDLLLTLGYDSDRPSDLRRFRDIQPDAFYPLYGDGSVRGYDAQSSGSLFARLDRRGASLLYGDFITASSGSARSLSTYSRSLTGVQQHFENRRTRVDAFASRGRARQTVDELRGLGVSGPYTLSRTPIVENSEQVEILVRDRNQPGVVLSASARTRFTDYEVDPYTGRLLFKQPIPSHDGDLNPVSIRVAYETRDGGNPYWVGGVETRFKIDPRLEVGGSVVADDDVTNPYRLGSLYAGARIDDATEVEGEFARTTAGGSPALGWRMEARHDRVGTQGRFWAASTDTGFANPHAGYAPGRTELGLRWSHRLDERARFLSEGMYTAEPGGDRRGGFLVGVDRGLSSTTRGEFGMRIAAEQRAVGESDPASVALRAKLTAQAPGHPELSGFAELEQDMIEFDRRLAAVGGEYRFSARGRLYARHELASTLTGPFALTAGQRRLATVVGVDADVTRGAHLFSEYRLADAFAAREAEAVLGLRNAWQVGDYRINTSFERVSPLDATSTGPTTALAGGLEAMADPAIKMALRMEGRTSRANDGYLTTMAAAFRVDRAWSVVARTLADLNTGRDRGNTLRLRNQIGFSFRHPDLEVLDALGRYEMRLDREPTDATRRTRHLAHVLSFHTTGRLYESFETSFAWAAKLADESADGLVTHSTAQWLHGRVARGFAKHWDAGVHGSTLMGSGSERTGLGAEIGRQMQPGVWMSAGWNRFGYFDPDLPDEAYTRAGFYLRVRARFDESIVGRIAGGGR